MKQKNKETAHTQSAGTECEQPLLGTSPKGKSSITNSSEIINPVYIYPYFEKNGCLYRLQNCQDTDEPKRICNFAPYIMEEDITADGCEANHCIKTKGIFQDGSYLPEFSVTAEAFPSMNWVTRLWVCLIHSFFVFPNSINTNVGRSSHGTEYSK